MTTTSRRLGMECNQSTHRIFTRWPESIRADQRRRRWNSEITKPGNVYTTGAVLRHPHAALGNCGISRSFFPLTHQSVNERGMRTVETGLAIPSVLTEGRCCLSSVVVDSVSRAINAETRDYRSPKDESEEYIKRLALSRSQLKNEEWRGGESLRLFQTNEQLDSSSLRNFETTNRVKRRESCVQTIFSLKSKERERQIA